MTINAKEIRSVTDQFWAAYYEKCLKKAAPAIEKVEKDIRAAAEKGEYGIVLTYKDKDTRDGVFCHFAKSFTASHSEQPDPKNPDKVQYAVSITW